MKRACCNHKNELTFSVRNCDTVMGLSYESMLTNYYADTNVQARIAEFLGGSTFEDASCAFVTGYGQPSRRWYDPHPVDQLWTYMMTGQEVARSLWDHQSLVAHLDIEYVNFDSPADVYLRPSRSFGIQRPVVTAIQEALLQFAIAPLHLLSGRGHHFVWKIDREAPAMAVLAAIGHLPDTLVGRYASPHPPENQVIPLELGAAFSGLGMVLELVAHNVIAAVRGACEVSVELTAVDVAPSCYGREMVSIDLSEYGDSLCTRSIRIPYSVYLKPQQQAFSHNGDTTQPFPPFFMIPLHEMNEEQGLLVMRDVGEVLKLARRASVRIPDQSIGTENLAAAYRNSALATFHDAFYATEHDPPAIWSHTYDRTPLESLPPCARHILETPNDRLLKPAGIQHVVRVLMSLGWHPRHIAGLIRSKYERDFGWGEQWYDYDAATRADFYTRIFAGRIATGSDDLDDFRCQSIRAKGYCPLNQCDQDLEPYRQRLLEARRVWQREAFREPVSELSR